MKIKITKVPEALETMRVEDLVLLIRNTLSYYLIKPADIASGFHVVKKSLPFELEIPQGNNFCLRRIRHKLKFEVEEVKEQPIPCPFVHR